MNRIAPADGARTTRDLEAQVQLERRQGELSSTLTDQEALAIVTREDMEATWSFE